MELNGQKREILGKASKGLKTEGLVPAVIFGKGLESTNITISKNDFIKVYREAGETGLIDIKIDGTNEKVMVKEVQYDPVYGAPIHVGFYKPNLKVKIKVAIPVEVVGEDKNELIKGGEAVIAVLIHEIEVEALPTDLPSEFTVDVSKLATIGDEITVADLNFDKSKVELELTPETVVLKLDKIELAAEEEPEVNEEEAVANLEATAEKPETEEEGSDKESK